MRNSASCGGAIGSMPGRATGRSPNGTATARNHTVGSGPFGRVALRPRSVTGFTTFSGRRQQIPRSVT
ncbi:hypothetical protein ACFPM0_06395 [Pseudonocardia sulfidoxydans]|uniref:hypothetical protein n=1 Tax=Pseudonocardia sulfidoxydans TaxID=54011 RepID=UPI003622A42A